MVTTEIMLLRHAEKPGRSGGAIGLMPDGRSDEASLTIRGWQRAGALAALFGSSRFLRSPLPVPDRIYASAFREGGGHSPRPEQTVAPLAQRLGRAVDLTWALHQEPSFGAMLNASAGTSLVCWQHQGLPALARAVAAPQPLSELPAGWHWPRERYDVVWSLRRDEPGAAWLFTQYCPCLLSGDQAQPFDLPTSTDRAPAEDRR